MKKTAQLLGVCMLVAMPVWVYAGNEGSVFSQCLALAPNDQEFSIKLDMRVDTHARPAKKTGTFSVTNGAGPNITQEEKAAFDPMIECIKRFLQS